MKMFLVFSVIFAVFFSCKFEQHDITVDSIYRGNLRRQGAYETKPLMKVSSIKWKFKAGDRIFSSPVIDGDTVLIGSDNCYFYAINKVTGEQLWRYRTRDGVRSSALVACGIVYFSDYKNYIYALDRNNGTLKWEFNMSKYSKVRLEKEQIQSGFDDYLPSPALYGHCIIVCSLDPVHPLFALDAATGREKWKLKIKSGNYFYGSPSVCGNTLYTGGIYGGIYAIDPSTGKVRWEYKLSNSPVRYSIVVGNDRTVFATTKNHIALALDGETGKLKWKSNVTENTWITGNPAYAAGMLFTGSSNDKRIFALDGASGKTKWSYLTSGWIYSSPIYVEGIIYAGCSDRCLYALDAKTGKNIWKHELEAPVYSTPAVENGVLYVGCNDGYVYALQ